METIISIIIPCYNAPKELISDAVNSVLNQDFNNYEVIIVDDGSEHEYHSFLEDLVKVDSRIVLKTIANSGVSHARNEGVMLARGKYIGFLDADDTLSSHFLRCAYEIALSTEADFIIGGTHYTIDRREMNNGDCSYEEGQISDYQCFEGGDRDLIKPFLSRNAAITFENGYIGRGPWARLVKKELIETHLFPEHLSTGEDVVWNLNMLEACRKVCIVKDVWYWYWNNPESVTQGKYNSHIYEDWLRLLKDLERFAKGKGEDVYCAYIDCLYDGMYQIWNCFLCYESLSDSRAKAIRQSIKSAYPWVLFKEKKYRKQANNKMKILSSLYSCGLIFLLFRIKRQKRTIMLRISDASSLRK